MAENPDPESHELEEGINGSRSFKIKIAPSSSSSVHRNRRSPTYSNEALPPGSIEELPMVEDSPTSSNYRDTNDDPIDTCFFEDDVRRIDFILVNKTNQLFAEKMETYRQTFEKNLIDEGLQLESCQGHRGNSVLRFVKIHAPWDVIARYAEILHFKMPVKPIGSWKMILSSDDNDTISKNNKFTATWRRDKAYMFDISPNRDAFFTSAQRSRIVDFILKRKSYGEGESDASSLGIDKLIEDGAYVAAYPLHEGKISNDYKDSPRMQLYNNWASFWHFFDPQPLDEIRKYLGVKIAMYFAWLGFYTTMLIPASLAGLTCFIYSIITYPADKVSVNICKKKYNDVAMCPLCSDADCDYWLLSASCIDTFVSYLFDNPSTIAFAIFMSVWSVVFTEIWKRYSAVITYQWDISKLDYYDEVPRPEYLAKLDKCEKKRLNYITRMYEPYVPFWRKRVPNMILSGSVVLFFISIMLFVVIGVIFYRISVKATLSEDLDPKLSRYSSLISSISASVINVILIVIFNAIHTKLAYKLTEMELPRTQTDFDNSLTIKLYALQFVNYYSSLFYIAFIKGRFVRHPGDMFQSGLLNKEQCGLGGCFVELTIQLAIILIGKQAIFAFFEMIQPLFAKKKWTKLLNISPKDSLSLPQWEADFILTNWKSNDLFYEYLEMVIQFGMITLFVVAFPLAPLFALINNSLEIRLDARKFLCYYRRPVAVRVKGIGVWSQIINGIARISVLTSALIIAFTTSFIPKAFYFYKYGRTLEGYIPWSLSYYDTKALPQNLTTFINDFSLKLNSSTMCAYPGLRYSPGGNTEYQPRQDFWEVLVYRLAFVVIFHNAIWIFNAFLRWIIPDAPKSLQAKIRQNSYLTNEFIIQQESLRAKRIAFQEVLE